MQGIQKMIFLITDLQVSILQLVVQLVTLIFIIRSSNKDK